MKCLILFALVGFAVCAPGNSKTQGKFVWDLLKPSLSAVEIQTIVESRDISFPMLHTIPDTGFNCQSKAQPGFYADQEARCQVFHRCDQNMNQTSYLCVNSTIFNQITLVCDSWFNVDCEKSADMENFANSRLYTDLPLFDSPPADYIAPSQLILMQNMGVATEVGGQPIRPVVTKEKRKKAKKTGSVAVAGSASSSA